MQKTLKLAKKSLTLVLAALVVAVSFTTGNVAKAQFEDTLQFTQESVVLGLNQRFTAVSFNSKKLKATGGGRIVSTKVVGGNQVTFYGLRVGNVTVKICNENDECKNVPVKVQKAKVPVFKLAKNTLNIKAGEKVNVAATNSVDLIALGNSSAITTYAEGNKIFVTGVKAGSATVTACTSNFGCLPIFVKVKSAGVVKGIKVVKGQEDNSTTDNSTLGITQKNITIANKASKDITVNVSDKLTAVSDTEAVKTAVNSNRVTIYGMYVGNAQVKICAAGVPCEVIFVKVVREDSASTVYDYLRLSESGTTLTTGQTHWVTAMNGTKIVARSNNSYVANVSTNGNQIQIKTGTYTGKATISICSAEFDCVPYYLIVNPSIKPKRTLGSWKDYTLAVGQSASLYVRNYGYTAYYVESNSNQNAVSAGIKNSYLTVQGLAEGEALIKICPLQTGFSCGTVSVLVSNSAVSDNSKTISISDNNITIINGQTANITASTSKGLTAVSDSGAVRTAVNGNTITLYSTYLGDANVTVCGGNGACTKAYVRVADPNEVMR